MKKKDKTRTKPIKSKNSNKLTQTKIYCLKMRTKKKNRTNFSQSKP